MRTIKNLTDNKFLNIKEVHDPSNNVKGYQFAERLGIDSIAFLCYDEDEDLYLINHEYTPPTNEFHTRAFGGSLDKSKDKIDIVLDQVKEEAGFVVKKQAVLSLGSVFVSTQMNQYCHLYLVYVDKNKQEEREPENAIEAMASTKWVTKDQILSGNDWKSITILAKLKVS